MKLNHSWECPWAADLTLGIFDSNALFVSAYTARGSSGLLRATMKCGTCLLAAPLEPDFAWGARFSLDSVSRFGLYYFSASFFAYSFAFLTRTPNIVLMYDFYCLRGEVSFAPPCKKSLKASATVVRPTAPLTLSRNDSFRACLVRASNC